MGKNRKRYRAVKKEIHRLDTENKSLKLRVEKLEAQNDIIKIVLKYIFYNIIPLVIPILLPLIWDLIAS